MQAVSERPKDTTSEQDGAPTPGLLSRHDKTIQLILTVYFLASFAVPPWFNLPKEIRFYIPEQPLKYNLINSIIYISIISSFFVFKNIFSKIIICIVCTFYTFRPWIDQFKFWIYADQFPKNGTPGLILAAALVHVLGFFCIVFLVIKFFTHIINKIILFVNLHRKEKINDKYTQT